MQLKIIPTSILAYINKQKFTELCNNIENINFFKGTGDHSEIAFIKKKL